MDAQAARTSGFSKIVIVVVLAALSLILGDLGERMASARAKEAMVRRQQETIAQLEAEIAWYENALQEIQRDEAVVRWARAHAKYIFEGEQLAIPVALENDLATEPEAPAPAAATQKTNLQVWLDALLGP